MEDQVVDAEDHSAGVGIGRVVQRPDRQRRLQHVAGIADTVPPPAVFVLHVGKAVQ